jgi:hypothetical protein
LQTAFPDTGIAMLDLILLTTAFGAFGLLGLYVRVCGWV